jgi:hypothetical protein
MMAVRDRQRITQSPFYIKDVAKKKEKFKLHFPARSVPSIGAAFLLNNRRTPLLYYTLSIFHFFIFFLGIK